MVILGIDPGKKGGLALLDGDHLVNAWPYSPGRLSQLLHTSTVDLVAVEQVHAMPGQGVTSMFHFGETFGVIQGICYHAGYCAENGRLSLVTPQRWKSYWGLIGCDKSSSIGLAMNLYPDVDFRPSTRAHTPSDGMAEATLIAGYAAANFMGGN